MLDRPEPLHPDYVYRTAEVARISGYRPTQLAEKVKSGEFPASFKLSDSGRARGWFGRDLIAWQEARAAARAAGDAETRAATPSHRARGQKRRA